MIKSRFYVIKSRFYVIKSRFYVIKSRFYSLQLIENQLVLNPSNRTKLYKYTNCDSREKKAFKTRWLTPAGKQKANKTL